MTPGIAQFLLEVCTQQTVNGFGPGGTPDQATRLLGSSYSETVTTPGVVTWRDHGLVEVSFQMNEGRVAV